MLKQLLERTLNAFGEDYKAFSKHHYPTIHNRGLSLEHLSSAFLRRLLSISKEFTQDTTAILFSNDVAHQPSVYLFTFNNEKVWCIFPPFLNAKTEAKSQIYFCIEALIATNQAKPNDHFIILCDHWFDRTKSSKALYYWWTGHQPLLINDYLIQGIHPLKTPELLSDVLKVQYEMEPITLSITHPIESKQHQSLLKYFLCFALLQYKAQPSFPS